MQTSDRSVKRICVFSNYNQYESKRHFCIKLTEALRRQGVEVEHVDDNDLSSGNEFVARMAVFQPDLTCSFNRFTPTDGSFWWDVTKSPHLSILVDPSYYDMNILKSPYSIVSCVDRYDVKKIQEQGFDRVFFWPHGVEKELHEDPSAERPYDVVMIGTCYDPESLREYWRSNAPAELCKVIEDAIDLVLTEKTTHFQEATNRALAANNVPLDSPHAPFIPYFVDYYSRGIDRLELIRSVKDVKVHVFGEPCWRNLLPVRGWEHYLAKDPNVELHPGISYLDSIEIIKRSKICLNSVPMFRAGSHERVLNSLACGCGVVSSESTYLRENFQEGEGMIFYEYPKLNLLNEIVMEHLHHPESFQSMIKKGQTKVAMFHTWDTRAKQLLSNLPPLLNKIPRAG